jgi:thioesterase domain-containing protein/acyl carrier protein
VLAVDEGGPRLVAFMVPASGADASPRELAAHAARLLPRSLVPAEVVSVPRIPANVNGKTDAAALLAAWRRADADAAREAVPPADEHEERLAAIFARVLGVARLGVTDSFFELGGHSLLIFKLIAACSHELHVRPSVADVFSAPSVRELAARMAGSLGDPDASLVPLVPRPGQPLLVFVHAASGSVLPFLETARRLEDFSTFGLQAPEEEVGRVVRSVEDLAARYVEAVDAVRGMSPVALAGWSMGGCIALEMARRWRERGVEAAAVLMLDTWTPPSVLASPAAQARARKTILEMDVLGLEGFAAEELEDAPDAVARLAGVLERNREAFLDYAPEWYDGEVDLLRAAEPFPDPAASFPDEYALPDRGWSRRVRGVAVREVAGNHFTLVAREHAGTLAAAIRDAVSGRIAYTEL